MLFNKICVIIAFLISQLALPAVRRVGSDDLVSLLIYIRKSSCVVLFKESFKESLHGNNNVQLLSIQGGSDPCLNLKPDPILTHPSFLMHPRIRCSKPLSSRV